MTTENHNENCRRTEYYVVCVVDLLGQSELLMKWSKLPASDEESKKFMAALCKTVGAIEWFKNFFTDRFKTFASNNLPAEQWSQLTSEQQQQFLRFKSTELKLQQFSDLFLFYAPLRNCHGDLSPTPICRIIATCCLAMFSSLAVKMPLRGAVCFGTGLELQPGNFFGPALAQAHHIESKIAEYPRIVISREVIDFLSVSKGFSEDVAVDQCLAEIAKSTLEFTCKDKKDGLYIANFMGQAMRDISNEDVKAVKDGARLAFEFVVSEHHRFVREKNTRLAERYSWLEQYMKAHLPLWELDELLM